MAKRESVLSGSIELPRLERLVGVLESRTGSVDARLRFRQSGGDWTICSIIDVEYDTTVQLSCQRCLGPVDYRVEGGAHLAVLEDASLAQHLAEGFEPLVLEDERLVPLTLIEDEVLLALPLVPRHDPGSCEAPAAASGKLD